VLPVHHFQIAERFFGGVVRPFFGRQQKSFGQGKSQVGYQAVVEEFFVSTPPERIVDDVCPIQRSVFQISTVEGYILRNPVDDDGVAVIFTFSIKAQGKVSSIPNKIPIFFDIILLIKLKIENEG